ncbi:photoreceptor outer segment membrane glycoprotein 2-like [Patella vulgata]|uniref:photoreceptor outer segment membrane glycoprotein 2-like n=1 Tax=Patella vulgata TaxID=6465 RepID=UPI0024A7C5B6|nr:photoreceptor outer segment membrane glycoprotein 2-like [Patella vulgata]
MKFKVEVRTIILENYDTGILPHMLVSIGCLLFVFHIIGAKISNDCGHAESRRTFHNMMMCFIVLLAAMSIVLIAGGSMCFAHRNFLGDAFKKGLLSSMKLYKENETVKEMIDRTQLEFRCCGSTSYKDWFEVSWINGEDINMEHPDVQSNLKHGNYYGDDVPFSCCRINSSRPCIFHKWLIIILLRHLQTSINEAIEEGDPEGGGDAYCFSQAPCYTIL